MGIVYAGGSAGGVIGGLLGGQLWDSTHRELAGTLAALDGLSWVGWGVLLGATAGLAVALAVFHRGLVLITAGLTMTLFAVLVALSTRWVAAQVGLFFIPGIARIAAMSRSQSERPLAEEAPV